MITEGSLPGSFVHNGTGPWTATVDYGDGSGTHPLTLGPDKTFQLDHAYTTAGAFVTTVSVTDRFGLIGEATFSVSVAAKPIVHSGSFALSATAADASERSGSITITVLRTGGTDGEVTVSYATTDGSAVNGASYVAAIGTLTFGPGVSSQTITIPILDEGLTSGTKSFTLSLSNPGGGATLGTPSSEQVTIHDDDSLPPPSPTVRLVSTSVAAVGKGNSVVVLRFSGSVEASSARDLKNFRLMTMVKKGRHTVSHAILLKSAIYNDATKTITLTARKKFVPSTKTYLQVIGDGLRDDYGRNLDVNQDGIAGGVVIESIRKNRKA